MLITYKIKCRTQWSGNPRYFEGFVNTWPQPPESLRMWSTAKNNKIPIHFGVYWRLPLPSRLALALRRPTLPSSILGQGVAWSPWHRSYLSAWWAVSEKALLLQVKSQHYLYSNWDAGIKFHVSAARTDISERQALRARPWNI